MVDYPAIQVIVSIFYSTLIKVFDFLNTPIKDIPILYEFSLIRGIDWFIGLFDTLGGDTFLGDFTLISIMLGEAIFFYLFYQFITWLANLIT